MERRTFFAVVAGGIIAAPLAAEAQQAGNIYRIGYVTPGFDLSAPSLAFNRGLRDTV